MAHVVETGSGSSTANSYESAVGADAYFLTYPNVLWTGDAEDVKEPALRQATQYLDGVYGERWKGRRISGTQALDFPRSGIQDRDGIYYEVSPLPAELRAACAELAVRILDEGTDLQEDIDESGTILSESVEVGPVSSSTTYASGKSQIPWRPKVDRLLAPLLLSGSEIIRG